MTDKLAKRLFIEGLGMPEKYKPVTDRFVDELCSHDESFLAQVVLTEPSCFMSLVTVLIDFYAELHGTSNVKLLEAALDIIKNDNSTSGRSNIITMKAVMH